MKQHTSKLDKLESKIPAAGPEIRCFYEQDNDTLIDQHGTPFTREEYERWCAGGDRPRSGVNHRIIGADREPIPWPGAHQAALNRHRTGVIFDESARDV